MFLTHEKACFATIYGIVAIHRMSSAIIYNNVIADHIMLCVECFAFISRLSISL